MPRTEKDNGNGKNSRLQRKKRGSGGNDDDDEVDSKGNIRGLIAYSDETDEEEESPRISRRGFKPRKAAVVAKEKIKAKLQAQPKKPLEVKKHADARRRPEKPRLRKYVSEEETSISEDEDEEEDEEEEDGEEEDGEEEDEDGTEEDEEDDDEDYDEDDEDGSSPRKMILNFGFGGASEEVDTRMVPKRV